VQGPLSQRDLERFRPDRDVRGRRCFRGPCVGGPWGSRFSSRRPVARPCCGAARLALARFARGASRAHCAEPGGGQRDRNAQKRPARPACRGASRQGRPFGTSICSEGCARVCRVRVWRPPVPVSHEHQLVEARFPYTKVGSTAWDEELARALFTHGVVDAKNAGRRAGDLLRWWRGVALLRQAMSSQMNRTARRGCAAIPRAQLPRQIPGQSRS